MECGLDYEYLQNKNSSEARDFSLLYNMPTGSEAPAQPPTKWYLRSCSGIKQLASATKIKNEWSYTSPPPVRLHGMDKVNFTLTFNFPLSGKYVPSALSFAEDNMRKF
jgi:hypothetical protein